MSLTPATMRRLMRELAQLKTSPPEGIRVQTSEDNMFDVTGIIQGPEGTPYAGGYFRVKFTFTEEFPAAPPKCRFTTKIFHPNVSGAGEICVNTLKKDWKPEYGIEHILVTVKCLLIYPNPESALDEEAGKLLLEDYGSYCSRAKLITSIHATPRVPPVEFDTPSAEPSATPTSSSAKPASASAPVRSKPLSSGPASQPPPHIVVPKSISSENDGAVALVATKEKDARHISPTPAPLGPADSNVALLGNGLVPPAANAPGENNNATKTVTGKRAASSAASSGAEKRKKALKRL